MRPYAITDPALLARLGSSASLLAYDGAFRPVDDRPILAGLTYHDGRWHTFRFSVAYGAHPGAGRYVRWGDFAINLWFTAKSGGSWAAAAAAARSRLLSFAGGDPVLFVNPRG